LFKCSWILSLTAFVFGGIACANASPILLLGSYDTSILNVLNGDYIFNTNFLVSSSDVSSPGSITVLDDDTVSVPLNDHLILEAAAAMGSGSPDSDCSNAGPNCVAPVTFAFSGLQTGLNQLEFDVKQVDSPEKDLEFSAAIGSLLPDPPSVPEPLSLALFGTGILGLVGLSRRYVRAQ
jgi:PEP-CTERM motif